MLKNALYNLQEVNVTLSDFFFQLTVENPKIFRLQQCHDKANIKISNWTNRVSFEALASSDQQWKLVGENTS